MNALNPYLKTVVVVISTVLTGLASYYGHTSWYPIATSAMSILLVYLVPNIPNSPPPTAIKPQDKPPFTGE